MALEKLSAAAINDYMVKAASTLRSQEAEIQSLREKVASYERKEHAEKIASLAVSRGVIADDDADDYAEHLADSGEDLKMVEDFIGRASNAPTLGKPLEKTASAEGEVTGRDVLTEYLLSSDFAQ